MHAVPDAMAVARGLAATAQWRDVRPDDLRPLTDKGLAHAHWEIAGRGLVVRVPRSAAGGRLPAETVRVQAEGFRRLEPSGRTPRLRGVIEPSDDLPCGALVVEHVVGHPPRLPAELPLLAETLAAIHALPLPPPAERAPLDDPPEPFAATLKTIDRNRPFLDGAGVAAAARRQIDEELAWARGFAARIADTGRTAPRTLVVLDAHPGNFIVTSLHRAVFVDLEKAAYGSPAIDVAHATLRPSTRWDPDCGAVLSGEEIGRFMRAYFAAVGPAAEEAIRPWLLPFRRLTWLRTTLAFARFRVERTAASLAPVAAAHAEAVISDSLSPDTIDTVRREWLGADALTF